MTRQRTPMPGLLVGGRDCPDRARPRRLPAEARAGADGAAGQPADDRAPGNDGRSSPGNHARTSSSPIPNEPRSPGPPAPAPPPGAVDPTKPQQ